MKATALISPWRNDNLTDFTLNLWGYALYDTILDRAPDHAGLDNFVAAIKSGKSLLNIVRELLSSAEYQAKFGLMQNVAEPSFVERIHDDAHRRQVRFLEAARRLVDPVWCAKFCDGVPPSGDDPVEYFLRECFYRNLPPNSLFEPTWYLSQYPDIAAARLNPFVHYIVYGWREGRDPGPNFKSQAYLSCRPELRNGSTEPLAHYFAHDWLNAEFHHKLGDELKRQGAVEAAIHAYSHSFRLKPRRMVFQAIRALNATIEPDDRDETERSTWTWFEIGDLLTVMQEQAVVSGIQRVQFGILSYVQSHAASSSIEFVCWFEGELWKLSKERLVQVVDHYKTSGGCDFDVQRKLIASVIDHATLVRPARDDTFVSTGVVYFQADLIRARDNLRARGVKIGMAIYDFIPLTNPEFCDPTLINQFSPSMSEALVQVDFAITISEFVAGETRRLMQEAAYPPILIEAVPLARVLELSHESTDESGWTSGIACLRDSQYVLCVSTLNAHKNHMFLVNLWRLLIAEGIKVPKLVFAGRRSYGVDDLFHQLTSSKNLDGSVLVIDGPTDMEVSTLYRHCLFTVFASYVEGWGLPVGESLARGKLCVASETTSIPEAGGDLALYFDPYNVRGAATIVRRLLECPQELKSLEAKIQTEFRPRSWDAYARDFITTVASLSADLNGHGKNPGPRLDHGRMLLIQDHTTRWKFGTHLPPYGQITEMVLPRVILGGGWKPLKGSGVSMVATLAKLNIPVDLPLGARVQVVLRVQATNPSSGDVMTIATRAGAETKWSPPFDRRGDFIARVDTLVTAASRIELEVRSPTPSAFRLLTLECSLWDPSSRALPSATLLRPTTLIGFNQRVLPGLSQQAVARMLKQRAMLRDGWAEPEIWGAWMLEDVASVDFNVVPSDMKSCRVLMRLRVAPAAEGMKLSIASSHANKTIQLSSRSLFLSLDGRPDGEGKVELQLRLSGQSQTRERTPLVGLESLIYGEDRSPSDLLVLAEAMLFDDETPRGHEDLLRDGLKFNVTGHINGSYSLANVNRLLALSLDAVRPGSVRISQVEGQPVNDLSAIPARQGVRIAELASRPACVDGLEVSIFQHWPIWKPAERSSLSLAMIFWEEGLAPRDMVRALNQSFGGILAPSKFVAKALRDSGVHTPIRVTGFAPDLDDYMRIGQARLRRPRVEVTATSPFTFLHVSSCFPRKGVDAMLEAYAQGFTADDPVNLVIKTFPNPHNDVERQIEALRIRFPNLPPIRLISQDLSDFSLREFYGQSGAMVLPSRGEGFNLPAAEALAAGLQLIVTGFGAHLDFVKPTFARLLDYTFEASRSHLKSSGSTWVDVDIADLKSALCEALDLERCSDRSRLEDRIELGRAAAAELADATRWANRIQMAAYDVLSMPDQHDRVKVAWVSSWDVRCGIAEYSKMLLDTYPNASRDIVVFCDDRTVVRRRSDGAWPQAKVAWRAADALPPDDLIDQITRMDPNIVVIQHHKALIGWPHFTKLLECLAGQRRTIVACLHNVQEIPKPQDDDYRPLIDALRAISRILVHTINDLNLLKSHGLLANVAMFPHGAPRMISAPNPRSVTVESSPLLGAYGFMLPHKGFAALIEAFSIIRSEWPNARLRMVTAEYPVWFSGTALKECRGLAHSLGLEAAIEWHTDYLPTEKSLALLNECDVIIMPYQETPESSSAAARTALASGIPVVVTPIPVFENLEDAVLRLHGTDVQSIAGGVAWFLRHPVARADIRRQASIWQEANDWEAVSERLHDMIKGLHLDRVLRWTEQPSRADEAKVCDVPQSNEKAELLAAL